MSRRAVRLLLLAVLALGALAAGAADTPLGFSNPALQRRYDALLDELRCLVCQNQSLADSHANLAQDLRREVHRMLARGASDEEVQAFMVERYGDFVLYRPPLKATTVLLWTAPVVLALAALAVVVRLARRRATAPAALSAEERARLDALREAERDEPR